MVFHNSSDAIFMLNEQHEIIDVNTTAEKMFQRNKEELLAMGSNLLQKFPFTNEELMAAREIVNSQGVFQKEVEYVRVDGSEFWGLISITKFKVEQDFYVLIRVVDIDELKRTEKQLEYNRNLFTNVFDTSEDGIFIMTSDWIIQYVNNGALSLFQHDIEHFINKYASVLNDMLVVPFSETERQAYVKLVLNNENFQKEQEYYRKDGSTFYGLLTTTPFQSESDSMILIRMTFCK
jgi:PAS domain S-box-containing protein